MLPHEAQGHFFVSSAPRWDGVAIKGTITCTCKLAEAETNYGYFGTSSLDCKKKKKIEHKLFSRLQSI